MAPTPVPKSPSLGDEQLIMLLPTEERKPEAEAVSVSVHLLLWDNWYLWC
jgi:hypothetical protein